jgi:hypothetical protein
VKTGISRRDIRSIILDLKGQGWLRGSFNSTTGKADFVTPSPESAQEPQEIKSGEIPTFCPHCGTSTESGASFCSYCGMKLKD